MVQLNALVLLPAGSHGRCQTWVQLCRVLAGGRRYPELTSRYGKREPTVCTSTRSHAFGHNPAPENQPLPGGAE